MQHRTIFLILLTAIMAEILGLPASGLLMLLGMLAVATAGVLAIVGADATSSGAFSLGLGAVAGGALVGAAGGAVRAAAAGLTLPLPGWAMVLGSACLVLPILALSGLHLLARGLATLPDRPPPTPPRVWRQAEVLRPDDRPRAPRRARARRGDDDLGLLGGDE